MNIVPNHPNFVAFIVRYTAILGECPKMSRRFQQSENIPPSPLIIVEGDENEDNLIDTKAKKKPCEVRPNSEEKGENPALSKPAKNWSGQGEQRHYHELKELQGQRQWKEF